MPRARRPPKPTSALRPGRTLRRVVQRLRDRTRGRLPAARVHDLHRQLRRLELELGLVAPALPKDARRRLRDVQDALHEISHRVGAARDRDVQLRLLAQGDVRTARPVRTKWRAKLRAKVTLRADKERTRLRRAVGKLRTTTFPRHLRQSIGDLERRTGSAGLERAWSEGESDLAARAWTALTRARERPTPRRLHAFRRSARALRVARELRSDAVRRRGPPDVVRRLQSELGHLHDLDVFVRWTEGRFEGPAARAWSRSMGARAARLRRKVRVTLEDRAIEAWIRTTKD